MNDTFISKIYLCPMSGCWLWTASLYPDGYGQHMIAKKLHRAHRLMWALCNGAIPHGMQVLHRCDVRSCVNPTHLFLGTNADNMRDKVAKGRHHKAEQIKQAKLNKDAITEMRLLRAQGFTYTKIGQLFGVSHSTANLAIVGKTWKAYAP